MNKLFSILTIFLFFAITSFAQWTQQNSGTTEYLLGVDFQTEDYGFAVGSKGTLLATADGGENWVSENVNFNNDLRDVSLWGDSSMVIVGDSGIILTSSNRGEQLNDVYLDNYKINYTVNARSDGSYFLTQRTQYLYYRNSSNDIDEIENMQVDALLITDWELEAYDISPVESGIFVSTHRKFADEEYAIYRLNPDENNLEEAYVFPHGNGEFEDFYTMDFVNLNVGFVGGKDRHENINGAAVYKTTDGGESFTRVHYVPQTEKVTDIFFLNENYGWIVIDNEFILRTIDGGENWSPASENISSSTRISEIVFVDENVGYAVGLRGSIYKTTNGGGAVTSVEDNSELPNKLSLAQNYPNPFNPSTSISYSIPKQSNVSLKVYDVIGKEVAELVNAEKSAGSYEVDFNGENLSSGIYFYTLKTNNSVLTKKMMLIK